jgi:uncharacterized protein YndB with AHSA1/START domain
MNDLTLTVSRLIKASPKRIYDAWLDPATMARFMFPRPDMHISAAEADPVIGGRFRVVMVGDRDLPHEGTYRELVPHSRLVFTWEAPWSAPDTTVTIILTQEGDATRVDLTHIRFLSEESRDSHAAGWAGILANLETCLS